MRKGKMLEQGTHEGLLSNRDGAYYALVNAQSLSMAETFGGEPNLVEETLDDVLPEQSTTANELVKTQEEATWKNKGIVQSFGLFLYEQRRLWPWYLMLLAGCMAAGATQPVQAWLFAQVISVFAETGSELSSSSAHWALMYLFLAIGAGVAYFCLGYSANTVTQVSQSLQSTHIRL